MVMARKVFLRGIDEKLYAEVKARAAILGITVSEAVNRALEVWLRTPISEVIESSDGKRKLREVERLHGEEYRGKYVVVCDGRLVKVCDDEEEARRAAVSSGATQCIIARIGEGVKEEVIELGMGVLE